MDYSRPLDFEKDYLELKLKLEELKSFAMKKQINLSSEIEVMEARMGKLNEEKYKNLSAWQKYQVARHLDRPSTLDYVGAIIEGFVELRGDRCFGDDLAIVGGLGWFEGMPVTVIGHQKGKDTNQNIQRNFGMPHPEGYRKALRLMKQAEKFGRPLICFIDTPGAHPGAEAEERGQAWAIAQCLAEMSSLAIPTISVLIGEGCSGGALALGVADWVMMMSNATYSVISPHGCASILWNDLSRTEEMANHLKITAPELLTLGVIDEIIAEPLEGAHREPEQAFQIVAAKISISLQELMSQNPSDLVENRYQRLKRIGIFLS
ncbi:MAG: acetyl-CoA carboxylase carboxyltransferase subunit alpha [Syntrophomonadaceae bacterium]|nr:acetyl-CoA carboxylase carboxyltransferase subunit alpha [Syntrophomonadaceae bacterium]